MAILLTKTPVCDEGLDRCDNTTLHNVRLTIDGKTSARVFCTKHAAPYVRLKDKMGPEARSPRGKIYTPEEIARKRAAKKA